MSRPVLEVNGVSKHFGQFRAVSNISLTIPKGSIYGFLGPNGAGKTTTLRMVLDILRPDSGSISILGRPSALEVRHRLGYLPEEKGLYRKMKVWAIIAYFASLKGISRKLARQRAHTLLERYGLGEFADARVESLSNGMGQKVQVLASVVHEPEIVILDEPFSGLDPVNQAVLETLIRDMSANGQTVIFSTHVMQHAERLCDRVLLIARGQKIFDGSIAEAKAIIPRRVQLDCEQDAGLLRELEGVRAVSELSATDAGQRSWQIEIEEQASPQTVLQRCFSQGLTLSRFEYAEPSLHDVFVHLVSRSSRESDGGPAPSRTVGEAPTGMPEAEAAQETAERSLKP